jgi:hypothetical protein
MNATTCHNCNYPFTGDKCQNPGCYESGNTTKASWDEAQAQREADRLERESRYRAWSTSFNVGGAK